MFVAERGAAGKFSGKSSSKSRFFGPFFQIYYILASLKLLQIGRLLMNVFIRFLQKFVKSRIIVYKI